MFSHKLLFFHNITFNNKRLYLLANKNKSQNILSLKRVYQTSHWIILSDAKIDWQKNLNVPKSLIYIQNCLKPSFSSANHGISAIFKHLSNRKKEGIFVSEYSLFYTFFGNFFFSSLRFYDVHPLPRFDWLYIDPMPYHKQYDSLSIPQNK